MVTSGGWTVFCTECDDFKHAQFSIEEDCFIVDGCKHRV